MTIAADLDALWQAHHRAVKNYITFRVDSDLVDDILQDVYLRALSSLLRGVYPDKPLSWLYRIAHNLVIDYYRERNRALPTVDIDAVAFDDTEEGGTRTKGETEVAPELTPYELAERAFTCQCVRRAIGRLTREQEFVITRRMEGYEYGEIAAELGKSEGATKGLNTRAWAKLQASLQEVA